jgi:hypothetical protein
MRPRVNVIQKQETVKRKNRAHWSTHKDDISITRMTNKGKLKRLQKEKFSSSSGSIALQINDIFNYLSISENTDDADFHDPGSEASDTDFEKEYFIDIDENYVTRDSEDGNEEGSNAEEEIETDLSEEQVIFGNEFFNMENQTILIRDYDELVSNKSLL